MESKIMLKFIELMEDIAVLNSQISSYRSYLKSHNFVSPAFLRKIDEMEQKKKALDYNLRMMAMAI